MCTSLKVASLPRSQLIQIPAASRSGA
jgi:hypothetical protein